MAPRSSSRSRNAAIRPSAWGEAVSEDAQVIYDVVGVGRILQFAAEQLVVELADSLGGPVGDVTG